MQEMAVMLFVVLTVVIRAIAGTWAHPSAVTALYWTAALAIPTSLDMVDAPLATLAIGGILLGALISAPIRVMTWEVSPRRIASTRSLRVFVIAGAATGGAAGALTLAANQISLEGSLNLTAVNAAARSATVLRYGGELGIPRSAILLIGLTYGAALAAPFAAANARGIRRAFLLAAPTIGGGLFALATTARAGFLICAAITFASWLVCTAVEEGGRPRFGLGPIAGVLAAAVAIGSMFIYGALTRIGGSLSGSATLLAEKAAVYAGGSIPAFEIWMRDPSTDSGFSGGAVSLAGISQFLLGDTTRGSAYDARADIGDGLSTNVYTILRPLTEDFTFPGAILVLFLASLLAAHAYRTAIVRHSVKSAVLVSLWLAIVLFSTTTSILTFANVVFGLILASWLIVRSVNFEPLPGVSARAWSPGIRRETAKTGGPFT